MRNRMPWPPGILPRLGFSSLLSPVSAVPFSGKLSFALALACVGMPSSALPRTLLSQGRLVSPCLHSGGLPCHTRLGRALRRATVFSRETEGTHREEGHTKTEAKTAVVPLQAEKGQGLLGATGDRLVGLNFL